MANTLLTIAQITREALMVLENELTFTKMVNRQYSDEFAKNGAKIGDTVNVRKPPRYIGRRTAALSVESSTETYVPLKLTTQWGQDVSFTSVEKTLNIDDFRERFLKPAVATVANMIDLDGLAMYNQIYNVVGSGGTTPASMDIYLQAGELLDNCPAPKGNDRNVVMNARAQRVLVGADRAIFNPSGIISEQYRKGNMTDNSNGFNWSMDQNVAMSTTGTYAANVAGGAVTVTTSQATAGATTVVTGGWTSADQLNVGDTFTISGVFGINLQSRQTTGQLQNFVVTTAPAVASGGGAMTINFLPAVVFTGKDQTVSSSTNSIASGSVLKLTSGASNTLIANNLIFHKDAFTLGTADLIMPKSVIEGERIRSKKLGMSIRMITFYDGINDREITRLDVLGGWATLRPEFAVRGLG